MMIHERIRHPDERQRPLGSYYGVATDPRLARAIVAMEERIETPLDLIALAAIAGVTPRHLTRLFGRYHKITPTRIYRRLRLERAWHLLALTMINTTEIGFACGFSSLAPYSRAFKAEYGMPPRDARAVAPVTGSPGGGTALRDVRIDKPERRRFSTVDGVVREHACDGNHGGRSGSSR
jgi:transcriptional regulator GlxA family with amidase domain